MRAEYHAAITRTVLGRFFSLEPLEEIVAANLGQDSLLSLLGNAPYRHFCDRELQRSVAYIEDEHQKIRAHAGGQQDVHEQRAALGRLLHTVQDFYAHSNYIELWLRHKGGVAAVSADSIDGLDPELMGHPELHVGDWVVWRDLIYYVPVVGRAMRNLWLAPRSHEAMHLDAPDRGPGFVLALATARQRTTCEYQRALETIKWLGGEEAQWQFHHAS